MQRVEEDLTYDYLHSSEDNLWSVLYLTGYLTKVRKEELSKAASDHISNELSALKIPNEEIREIFETTIKNGLKIIQRYGTDSHYLMQSGRKTQKQQQRK